MGAKKINPAVVVKKVKPYPIPVSIFKSENLDPQSTPTTPPANTNNQSQAGQPILGRIVKLTTIGFQVEVSSSSFYVGQNHQVEFSLPLSNVSIKSNVKVIKTMDRFKDEKATIKEYLVEMHFSNLSKPQIQAIKKFEMDINQKLL